LTGKCEEVREKGSRIPRGGWVRRDENREKRTEKEKRYRHAGPIGGLGWKWCITAKCRERAR